MLEYDPFTLSRTNVVGPFDVFISFTRADAVGREAVPKIKEALKARGLRVFTDEDIGEFDGITQGLVDALASTKVLLAYYSEEFPTRYACQWELTAALIAARRFGNPADRVLAINPEGPQQSSHLKPIELADARFFDGSVTGETMGKLVDLVQAKVSAADGPLGAAKFPSDPKRMPARIAAPRRFVGRYPELWDVHSGLHATDFAGITRPDFRPAVMIRGIAGLGKSTLAEQYAYLYREAFPGGTIWTAPFDTTSRSLAGEDALSGYRASLREVAAGTLGMRVEGVGLARLRKVIADFFTNERERVLWVIDDVPAGLAPEVREELLIPSPFVRTILTSRSGVPDWDARTVELHGLSSRDGELLFTSIRKPADHTERKAVADFVNQCGGHPMAIHGAANAVRNRPGLLVGEDFVGYLKEIPPAVVGAIQEDVGSVGHLARELLRVAAVLAPAPIPASLFVGALDEPVTAGELGEAADELVERGLLTVADGGWQVHALVTEAVRDNGVVTGHAVRIAPLLLGLLAQSSSEHLVRHAERLAMGPGVEVAIQAELLRFVAASQERHGDLTAAVRTFDKILALKPDDVSDLLAAAKAEIACGQYAEAVKHARAAVGLADDIPTPYRGKLLAARALDGQGDYSGADQEFWTEYGDRFPEWMDEEERIRTAIAMAVRLRLRAKPRDAVSRLEPVVVELRSAPPGPLRDELAPAAKLELARVLRVTGGARVARVMAGEVAEDYRRAAMKQHSRRLEALSIQAEATLTLDFTELRPDHAGWDRSLSGLRTLKAEYDELLGEDNPLTMAVWVSADRALLALGRPKEALAELAETDQAIALRLGEDHPLRLSARHGMGLAHGQLREFKRQAEILEVLLPQQVRALGPQHLETVESQLDLGIALIMGDCGQRDRAVELVDTAAKTLREALGHKSDLANKATVAQAVLRLPQWLTKSYLVFERFFGTKKES